jgi:hypothetical protein
MDAFRRSSEVVSDRPGTTLKQETRKVDDAGSDYLGGPGDPAWPVGSVGRDTPVRFVLQRHDHVQPVPQVV